MKYPAQLRQQICSSIFRNSKRKDMHISKETVNEHFNKNKIVNAGVGRGTFSYKKSEMICILFLGGFILSRFCILYLLINLKKKTNVPQYLWFYFF